MNNKNEIVKTDCRTEKEIISDIIAIFENDEELFIDCIEELDFYCGYLGDDKYWNMDELDDLYHCTDPSEILRRAFFGYDEETYTTDGSGHREHGQFNPNREYFRYNGYGNLVSADYKDYSAHLDSYAVSAMIENRDFIPSIETSEELTALFDELEAEH